MRWLLGIFGLLLVLWCGWWFTGRALILREAEKLVEAQRADGALLEMASFGVKGFPSRFDLTATELRYLDAAGRNGWEGGLLRVYAMSWKPWHIILALPETQIITLGDEVVRLEGQQVQASLRAAVSGDLPLADFRITGGEIGLTSSKGWQLGAATLAFALRDGAGAGQVGQGGAVPYHLGLRLTGIRPDPALVAALAAVDLPGMPQAPLPDLIDSVHLDAILQLSAPLDRHLGGTRPRLNALDLTTMSLTWGELSLEAKGALVPDDQGFAAGRVELTVTGWQHLPVLLVAGGAAEPRMAQVLTNMLAALARDQGDADRIMIPLDLRDGWMNFGPLPLGPAPRLADPMGQAG